MKNLRSGTRTLLLAVLSMAVIAIGCSTMDTQAGQGGKQSLYNRLGGKPAITAVIDQFVANVANDKRINERFATTDIPRLKKNLIDQVCMASGGPCTYRGRDMKTTHAGMRITTADFNALVEDLVASLNTFKVPEAEKKELLGLLGPMKKDIVEIP
ncbi:MAG TPA: group 1 truncated hemoglobin [Nitrospiraceae bacterium]|nr:group 1 truncated hemoglobin [Nitrospiraceae bacterium]